VLKTAMMQHDPEIDYELYIEYEVLVQNDAVRHLIEAAPDLLRACREVLEILNKRRETDNDLVRILEDAIDLAEVGR